MPYKDLEKQKEYCKSHREELKIYSRRKQKEYYRIKHNLPINLDIDYRTTKTGNKNNLWKGDNVGYHGKHRWIIKLFGKANHCENNLNHKAKRYEWANVTGVYSRNKKDYRQLCVSCHRFLDKGIFCIRGHKFSKENTWIRKNGWRVCKTCNKTRGDNYKKKRNKEVCHLPIRKFFPSSGYRRHSDTRLKFPRYHGKGIKTQLEYLAGRSLYT